jgi:hypothetical protein
MQMSEAVGLSAEMVLVIVLRRDPEEISGQERLALEKKFPGRQLLFCRTDPRDYREHAAQCEELKPQAVVLPLERPIPSLAMERGIPHVVFVGGECKRLLPLEAQFAEFNPGA